MSVINKIKVGSTIYDVQDVTSGYTTNVGTVTSVAVKMNGTTKGTVTSSGTIDLGTVITAHQDISDKANDSAVVHKTGDETVAGKKTFSSDTTHTGLLYVDGATPFIMSHTSKIGLRATNNSNQNLGQINISDAWYGAGNGQFGVQMSALDSVGNKYNQFRISHNGPQYIVYDNATATETAKTLATTDQIPTVNNASLYLQASGTTKTTFTANSSSNQTFNIATGSANGNISVGGTDVPVKGLAALAYKASLAAGDIPSLAASKITSGTFDAARIPAATSTTIGGVKVSYSNGVLNIATE